MAESKNFPRPGDDRELGGFWTTLNELGRKLDRVLSRFGSEVRTPRSRDPRARLEPVLNGSLVQGAQPTTVNAEVILAAADSKAAALNAAALNALANPDADAARMGTLAHTMAEATHDYISLSTDVLELQNPLPAAEPVWAGRLDRQLDAIIDMAETLTPAKSRRKRRSS